MSKPRQCPARGRASYVQETEQDAKMSAKRETKEARMEDLRTVKAAKELAKKKERLAAGLSAESVLGQKKKLQSECCIVM